LTVMGVRVTIIPWILRLLLPDEGQVITDLGERRAYENDGLTARATVPLLVVLPKNTDEVSAVLKYCHERHIKIVPRGAGTSLSGGAQPLQDAIVLAMGRLNNILEIDYDNRCVRAQPGVTNLAITKAVEDEGFYYAPDPSSQLACSIGGNIAENSGGGALFEIWPYHE
jgi:glycolate oxidase